MPRSSFSRGSYACPAAEYAAERPLETSRPVSPRSNQARIRLFALERVGPECLEIVPRLEDSAHAPRVSERVLLSCSLQSTPGSLLI